MIKNRLREIRVEKGMSLAQVAALSGTTKGQVMKLEKGERRLTVGWMERLAKALGIDPADMLAGPASTPRRKSSGDTMTERRLVEMFRLMDASTQRGIYALIEAVTKPAGISRTTKMIGDQ